MSNAFEYGDAILPQETDPDTSENLIPAQIGSNQPYLNLATYVLYMRPPNVPLMIPGRFRMVVLADDILESFCETGSVLWTGGCTRTRTSDTQQRILR